MKEQKIARKLVGTVVASKTPKTVVVRIDVVKTHPKYKKQYRLQKTYPVHTEKAIVNGDKVEIVESRPISKRKHWKVLRKIS